MSDHAQKVAAFRAMLSTMVPLHVIMEVFGLTYEQVQAALASPPAPAEPHGKVLACSICGWSAEPCVHIGAWIERRGPVNEREVGPPAPAEGEREALTREGKGVVRAAGTPSRSVLLCLSCGSLPPHEGCEALCPACAPPNGTCRCPGCSLVAPAPAEGAREAGLREARSLLQLARDKRAGLDAIEARLRPPSSPDPAPSGPVKVECPRCLHDFFVGASGECHTDLADFAPAPSPDPGERPEERWIAVLSCAHEAEPMPEPWRERFGYCGTCKTMREIVKFNRHVPAPSPAAAPPPGDGEALAPPHTNEIPCPGCVWIVKNAPEGCNEPGELADWWHFKALPRPAPQPEKKEGTTPREDSDGR